MLSKNKIKLIRSLGLKKNRSEEGLFVAEGRKLVFDLIESRLSLREVFCTHEISAELRNLDSGLITELKTGEMERISSLKSTPEIIGLFEIPEAVLHWDEIKNDLCIALDSLQDPGNLGTIVRMADWFGIKNILCSEDCADLYNSKTVQATMGAIARVKVHYLSLKDFIKEASMRKIPVYGAFLEGENIFSAGLSSNGVLVMGNEGKGISKEIEALIPEKITIPNYPLKNKGSESLNVAVAASIVCAEFRRRIIRQ